MRNSRQNPLSGLHSCTSSNESAVSMKSSESCAPDSFEHSPNQNHGARNTLSAQVIGGRNAGRDLGMLAAQEEGVNQAVEAVTIVTHLISIVTQCERVFRDLSYVS